MITHFQEIFKGVSMKKTSLRNLLLVTLAVTVAKTFRINEIASRLPINVKTEKSKQKRLLRFLDTPFPLEAVKEVWCIFVLRCLWKKPQNYSFLLVDETELIDGWKAIVAAIPFRNRAIPVYWLIYRDQEIRDLTYKSHNKIVQDFCLKVYNLSLTASPKKAQRAPVFVFDRGFARAKYVIDFLKQRNIGFVMRICRNVGITVAGSSRRLDTLESGSYPNVLYHKTYQIPLNLYVVRNPAFKEPMYLISNVYQDAEIHQCYKRRMQIEHGFRDIKTRFGFRHIVLKKPHKARIALLWFIACLTYGLTFLCYEKTIQPVVEHRNTRRKLHAVITLIKDVLMETWTSQALLTALEDCRCRGDTCLATY
jgi:hypothetical protein